MPAIHCIHGDTWLGALRGLNKGFLLQQQTGCAASQEQAHMGKTRLCTFRVCDRGAGATLRLAAALPVQGKLYNSTNRAQPEVL
jgi:hypothetical protein